MPLRLSSELLFPQRETEQEEKEEEGGSSMVGEGPTQQPLSLTQRAQLQHSPQSMGEGPKTAWPGRENGQTVTQSEGQALVGRSWLEGAASGREGECGA